MKKSEKDLKKYELRIYNTVNAMDEAARNRFKALAHISDQLADISKQHDEEMIQLQYETDLKDKPLFELRKLIVQGLEFDAGDLNIDQFDKRLEEIMDENYEKIKIEESKNVTNLDGAQGIPDFWLIALKNNKIIAKDIAKKDEKLLKHLVDVEYVKVEGCNDFMLKFYFTPNDYMQNTVLTKRYFMDDQDHCKKVEGTKIRWRANMNLLESDPAEKNKGKKSKKKKKKNAEVEQSFFRFFDSKEECVGNPDEDDLDDDDEERLAMIEDDFMLAGEFRDEVVPLALEYYLNIVEMEQEEEDLEDNLGEGEEEVIADGEEVNDGQVVDEPVVDAKKDEANEDSDNSLDD